MAFDGNSWPLIANRAGAGVVPFVFSDLYR